jgi:DNA (cytosine-5)-methyltransferase 1
VDLYCKAGGAGMGYHRAGFDVVGVDIEPQPRYPFTFVQADAIDFLAEIVGGAEFFPQPSGISDMARLVSLRGFSAVHASPPCQAYTSMRSRWPDRAHPELIEPTRELLERIGLPYVIENVEGAPLRDPVVLCGSMFPGLGVRRHRLFECSFPVTQPRCAHDAQGPVVGVYGNTGAGGNRGLERRRGRTNGVADWRRAMGIDWMTVKELTQAIPPAYTEFIGHQMIRETEWMAA